MKIQFSIIIIIIVILIIFLISNNKLYKEFYKVNVHSINSTGTKSIGEIYSYPSCVTGMMCLTSSLKLKPNFKYNLNDNIRCVHNNSTLYNVDKSDLDNLVSFSGEHNVNFITCREDVNTLYSYVSGRYIKLLRIDNTPIKIRHISVYDRINNNLSLNKTIFVNPTYINSSGTIQYSDSILNSGDSVVTSFQTGLTKPYIQIDLGNNMNIAYVDIKHNTIEDAKSLNNAYLLILNDNVDDNNDEFGTVNFMKQISGSLINRRIYTYHLVPTSFPAETGPVMNVIETYTYPCTGCNDINGNLFKNSKYNYPVATKCFKVKDSNTDKTWLADAVANTISSSNLSKYFQSCTSIVDTTIGNKLYFYMPFSNTVNEIASVTPCTLQIVNTPVPFIDNSTNALRNGKPTIRFTSGSEINNKGGYLKISNNNNLFVINANEAFTIQFYVKFTGSYFWGATFSLNDLSNGILARLIGNPDALYINGTPVDTTSYFTKDVWYHINIVRVISEQKIKLFVDGTLRKQMSVANSSTVNDDPAGYLWIGTASHSAGDEGFNGWLSDFVLQKGEAIFTRIVQ